MNALLRLLRRSPPLWLRLGVSLALFAGIARLVVSVELRAPSRWDLVAAAAALMSLATAVNGAKWALVTRALGVPSSAVRTRAFARVYFEGIAISMLLPTGLGGDVYRTGFAARLEGSGYRVGFAGVLIDRLLGLMFLLLAAGSALVQRLTHAPSGVTYAAFAGLALIGARVAVKRSRAVRARVASSAALEGAIVLGAAYTAAWIGGLVLISYAFGIDAGVGDASLALLVTSVAEALPLSVGGFGAREGALTASFTTLGYSLAGSVGVAIGFTGVHLLLAAAGGSSLALRTSVEALTLRRNRRPAPLPRGGQER